MGAFCRSKCKKARSGGPRTHPTRAAPRTAARIGVTVGVTVHRPHYTEAGQSEDTTFNLASPMRNLVGWCAVAKVASLFASAFPVFDSRDPGPPARPVPAIITPLPVRFV